MIYEEALEYIHSFGKFVNTPGLLRMERLMDRLKNPQEKIKCIHIAGTNGKGSTAAMISSVLYKAGYKVGLYTSPYIVDFRERVQIDFNLIPKEELVALVTKVKPYVEEMEAEGERLATFEFITALAFLWFEKKDCDIVVLETGLGGRLDATNIIKNPLMTIITSISLDHTKILGETVAEIAFEKCGIIKEQGCTIAYPIQEASVMDVIEQQARIKHNNLVVPDMNQVYERKEGLEGNQITYKGIDIHIPLIGKHQVYNGITAIEAILQLETYGYKVGQRNLIEGILNTKWQGRIEWAKKSPDIIIDGSHNLSGIKALAEVLKTLGRRKIRVVFGMLEDKDYRSSLEVLAPYCEAIFLVKPNHPQGVACEKLLPVAKDVCKTVKSFNAMKEAIEIGIKSCEQEDLLVICGSLYMIGEAKKCISLLNI